MAYQATTATRKIIALSKRIRAIQGGTSASKTISVLLYLINASQTDKEPKVTSVVSESFPHLRRGAMKDFLDIMKTHGYYKDSNWSKTDFTYTFETGSSIEFFSADQPGKVRGPRRDRLFINEANNISYETFDQLEVRTKDFVILDWNPTNEYWFYTEVQPKRDDVELIILTYKDNEALDPQIVASIEQRKQNKSWWRVYGEGQLGEVETRIYKGWVIIDDVPPEAKLERYGLDYGYTNDHTAIMAIYRYNGGYVVDEVCYRKGMSNKQIADVILGLESAIVVPDSSEPKSNDELKSYGVDVIPAVKGQGSVNQGIQLVQSIPMWITKRSINAIREYRNYLWETDKDGKILNVPEGGNDHAMDAVRYPISSLNPHLKEQESYTDYAEEEPLFREIGI
jgi:phage terminase large subunit